MNWVIRLYKKDIFQIEVFSGSANKNSFIGAYRITAKQLLNCDALAGNVVFLQGKLYSKQGTSRSKQAMGTYHIRLNLEKGQEWDWFIQNYDRTQSKEQRKQAEIKRLSSTFQGSKESLKVVNNFPMHLELVDVTFFDVHTSMAASIFSSRITMTLDVGSIELTTDDDYAKVHSTDSAEWRKLQWEVVVANPDANLIFKIFSNMKYVGRYILQARLVAQKLTPNTESMEFCGEIVRTPGDGKVIGKLMANFLGSSQEKGMDESTVTGGDSRVSFGPLGFKPRASIHDHLNSNYLVTLPAVFLFEKAEISALNIHSVTFYGKLILRLQYERYSFEKVIMVDNRTKKVLVDKLDWQIPMHDRKKVSISLETESFTSSTIGVGAKPPPAVIHFQTDEFSGLEKDSKSGVILRKFAFVDHEIRAKISFYITVSLESDLTAIDHELYAMDPTNHLRVIDPVYSPEGLIMVEGNQEFWEMQGKFYRSKGGNGGPEDTGGNPLASGLIRQTDTDEIPLPARMVITEILVTDLKNVHILVKNSPQVNVVCGADGCSTTISPQTGSSGFWSGLDMTFTLQESSLLRLSAVSKDVVIGECQLLTRTLIESRPNKSGMREILCTLHHQKDKSLRGKVKFVYYIDHIGVSLGVPTSDIQLGVKTFVDYPVLVVLYDITVSNLRKVHMFGRNSPSVKLLQFGLNVSNFFVTSRLKQAGSYGKWMGLMWQFVVVDDLTSFHWQVLSESMVIGTAEITSEVLLRVVPNPRGICEVILPLQGITDHLTTGDIKFSFTFEPFVEDAAQEFVEDADIDNNTLNTEGTSTMLMSQLDSQVPSANGMVPSKSLIRNQNSSIETSLNDHVHKLVILCSVVVVVRKTSRKKASSKRQKTMAAFNLSVTRVQLVCGRYIHAIRLKEQQQAPASEINGDGSGSHLDNLTNRNNSSIILRSVPLVEKFVMSEEKTLLFRLFDGNDVTMGDCSFTLDEVMNKSPMTTSGFILCDRDLWHDGELIGLARLQLRVSDEVPPIIRATLIDGNLLQTQSVASSSLAIVTPSLVASERRLKYPLAARFTQISMIDVDRDILIPRMLVEEESIIVPQQEIFLRVQFGGEIRTSMTSFAISGDVFSEGLIWEVADTVFSIASDHELWVVNIVTAGKIIGICKIPVFDLRYARELHMRQHESSNPESSVDMDDTTMYFNVWNADKQVSGRLMLKFSLFELFPNQMLDKTLMRRPGQSVLPQPSLQAKPPLGYLRIISIHASDLQQIYSLFPNSPRVKVIAGRKQFETSELKDHGGEGRWTQLSWGRIMLYETMTEVQVMVYSRNEVVGTWTIPLQELLFQILESSNGEGQVQGTIDVSGALIRNRRITGHITMRILGKATDAPGELNPQRNTTQPLHQLSAGPSTSLIIGEPPENSVHQASTVDDPPTRLDYLNTLRAWEGSESVSGLERLSQTDSAQRQEPGTFAPNVTMSLSMEGDTLAAGTSMGISQTKTTDEVDQDKETVDVRFIALCLIDLMHGEDKKFSDMQPPKLTLQCGEWSATTGKAIISDGGTASQYKWLVSRLKEWRLRNEGTPFIKVTLVTSGQQELVGTVFVSLPDLLSAEIDHIGSSHFRATVLSPNDDAVAQIELIYRIKIRVFDAASRLENPLLHEAMDPAMLQSLSQSLSLLSDNNRHNSGQVFANNALQAFGPTASTSFAESTGENDSQSVWTATSSMPRPTIPPFEVITKPPFILVINRIALSHITTPAWMEESLVGRNMIVVKVHNRFAAFATSTIATNSNEVLWEDIDQSETSSYGGSHAEHETSNQWCFRFLDLLEPLRIDVFNLSKPFGHAAITAQEVLLVKRNLQGEVRIELPIRSSVQDTCRILLEGHLLPVPEDASEDRTVASIAAELETIEKNQNLVTVVRMKFLTLRDISPMSHEVRIKVVSEHEGTQLSPVIKNLYGTVQFNPHGWEDIKFYQRSFLTLSLISSIGEPLGATTIDIFDLHRAIVDQTIVIEDNHDDDGVHHGSPKKKKMARNVAVLYRDLILGSAKQGMVSIAFQRFTPRQYLFPISSDVSLASARSDLTMDTVLLQNLSPGWCVTIQQIRLSHLKSVHQYGKNSPLVTMEVTGKRFQTDCMAFAGKKATFDNLTWLLECRERVVMKIKVTSASVLVGSCQIVMDELFVHELDENRMLTFEKVLMKDDKHEMGKISLSMQGFPPLPPLAQNTGYIDSTGSVVSIQTMGENQSMSFKSVDLGPPDMDYQRILDDNMQGYFHFQDFDARSYMDTTIATSIPSTPSSSVVSSSYASTSYLTREEDDDFSTVATSVMEDFNGTVYKSVEDSEMSHHTETSEVRSILRDDFSGMNLPVTRKSSMRSVSSTPALPPERSVSPGGSLSPSKIGAHVHFDATTPIDLKGDDSKPSSGEEAPIPPHPIRETVTPVAAPTVRVQAIMSTEASIANSLMGENERLKTSHGPSALAKPIVVEMVELPEVDDDVASQSESIRSKPRSLKDISSPTSRRGRIQTHSQSRSRSRKSSLASSNDETQRRGSNTSATTTSSSNVMFDSSVSQSDILLDSNSSLYDDDDGIYEDESSSVADSRSNQDHTSTIEERSLGTLYSQYDKSKASLEDRLDTDRSSDSFTSFTPFSNNLTESRDGMDSKVSGISGPQSSSSSLAPSNAHVEGTHRYPTAPSDAKPLKGILKTSQTTKKDVCQSSDGTSTSGSETKEKDDGTSRTSDSEDDYTDEQHEEDDEGDVSTETSKDVKEDNEDGSVVPIPELHLQFWQDKILLVPRAKVALVVATQAVRTILQETVASFVAMESAGAGYWGGDSITSNGELQLESKRLTRRDQAYLTAVPWVQDVIYQGARRVYQQISLQRQQNDKETAKNAKRESIVKEAGPQRRKTLVKRLSVQLNPKANMAKRQAVIMSSAVANPLASTSDQRLEAQRISDQMEKEMERKAMLKVPLKAKISVLDIMGIDLSPLEMQIMPTRPYLTACKPYGNWAAETKVIHMAQNVVRVLPPALLEAQAIARANGEDFVLDPEWVELTKAPPKASYILNFTELNSKFKWEDFILRRGQDIIIDLRDAGSNLLVAKSVIPYTTLLAKVPGDLEVFETSVFFSLTTTDEFGGGKLAGLLRLRCDLSVNAYVRTKKPASYWNKHRPQHWQSYPLTPVNFGAVRQKYREIAEDYDKQRLIHPAFYGFKVRFRGNPEDEARFLHPVFSSYHLARKLFTSKPGQSAAVVVPGGAQNAAKTLAMKSRVANPFRWDPSLKDIGKCPVCGDGLEGCPRCFMMPVRSHDGSFHTPREYAYDPAEERRIALVREQRVIQLKAKRRRRLSSLQFSSLENLDFDMIGLSHLNASTVMTKGMSMADISKEINLLYEKEMLEEVSVEEKQRLDRVGNFHTRLTTFKSIRSSRLMLQRIVNVFVKIMPTGHIVRLTMDLKDPVYLLYDRFNWHYPTGQDYAAMMLLPTANGYFELHREISYENEMEIADNRGHDKLESFFTVQDKSFASFTVLYYRHYQPAAVAPMVQAFFANNTKHVLARLPTYTGIDRIPREMLMDEVQQNFTAVISVEYRLQQEEMLAFYRELGQAFQNSGIAHQQRAVELAKKAAIFQEQQKKLIQQRFTSQLKRLGTASSNKGEGRMSQKKLLRTLESRERAKRKTKLFVDEKDSLLRRLVEGEQGILGDQGGGDDVDDGEKSVLSLSAVQLEDGEFLDGSEYTGSDYTGSDFSGDDFSSSDYTGSDYGDSSYSGSDYTGSSYTGSSYTGSDYTGSEYTGSEYTGSEYSSRSSSVQSSPRALALLTPSSARLTPSAEETTQLPVGSAAAAVAILKQQQVAQAPSAVGDQLPPVLPSVSLGNSAFYQKENGSEYSDSLYSSRSSSTWSDYDTDDSRTNISSLVDTARSEESQLTPYSLLSQMSLQQYPSQAYTADDAASGITGNGNQMHKLSYEAIHRQTTLQRALQSDLPQPVSISTVTPVITSTDAKLDVVTRRLDVDPDDDLSLFSGHRRKQFGSNKIRSRRTNDGDDGSLYSNYRPADDDDVGDGDDEDNDGGSLRSSRTSSSFSTRTSQRSHSLVSLASYADSTSESSSMVRSQSEAGLFTYRSDASAGSLLRTPASLSVQSVELQPQPLSTSTSVQSGHPAHDAAVATGNRKVNGRAVAGDEGSLFSARSAGSYLHAEHTEDVAKKENNGKKELRGPSAHRKRRDVSDGDRGDDDDDDAMSQVTFDTREIFGDDLDDNDDDDDYMSQSQSQTSYTDSQAMSQPMGDSDEDRSRAVSITDHDSVSLKDSRYNSDSQTSDGDSHSNYSSDNLSSVLLQRNTRTNSSRFHLDSDKDNDSMYSDSRISRSQASSRPSTADSSRSGSSVGSTSSSYMDDDHVDSRESSRPSSASSYTIMSSSAGMGYLVRSERRRRRDDSSIEDDHHDGDGSLDSRAYSAGSRSLADSQSYDSRSSQSQSQSGYTDSSSVADDSGYLNQQSQFSEDVSMTSSGIVSRTSSKSSRAYRGYGYLEEENANDADNHGDESSTTSAFMSGIQEENEDDFSRSLASSSVVGDLSVLLSARSQVSQLTTDHVLGDDDDEASRVYEDHDQDDDVDDNSSQSSFVRRKKQVRRIAAAMSDVGDTDLS